MRELEGGLIRKWLNGTPNINRRLDESSTIQNVLLSPERTACRFHCLFRTVGQKSRIFSFESEISLRDIGVGPVGQTSIEAKGLGTG